MFCFANRHKISSLILLFFFVFTTKVVIRTVIDVHYMKTKMHVTSFRIKIDS